MRSIFADGDRQSAETKFFGVVEGPHLAAIGINMHNSIAAILTGPGLFPILDLSLPGNLQSLEESCSQI